MSERQYGKLADIRRDHVARYRFAADIIGVPDVAVIDAACGCGYGSYMLAQAGCEVSAYDGSEEAIAYAKVHYNHPRIEYKQALFPCEFPIKQVAVCFETLEHVEDPESLLLELRNATDKLIISVPNQEKLPFKPERFPFHFRHYTKEEFCEILNKTGWEVRGWYGQETAYSDVAPNVNGRTLIAVCE